MNIYSDVVRRLVWARQFVDPAVLMKGKMKRISQSTVALFLSLTLLVWVHLWTTGQIVCLGDDGHVQMERAGLDGFCVEAEVHAPFQTLSLDIPHCGVCVDMPVDVDLAKQGGPGFRNIVPLADRKPTRNWDVSPLPSNSPSNHPRLFYPPIQTSVVLII